MINHQQMKQFISCAFVVFFISLIIATSNRSYRKKNTIEVNIKEISRNNQIHKNPIPIRVNPIPPSRKLINNNNIKIITTPTPQRVIQTPPIQNKITQTKVGNSVIKQESIEYTLPALPIDSSHRIDYYYPYFYKTHVVDYYDNINISELTQNCKDIGCEWCDLSPFQNCKQCRHGYYLFNNQCYSVCPNNYVADIFKRSCHPLDITNSLAQISYLKAFTIGSCQNLCGKVSSDCSCLPTCVNEGNCCSDYNICEMLLNKNHLRQADCNNLNPNCDLCEFPSSPPDLQNKCGQCKEGQFLREGQCVQSCFPEDLLKPLNKICLVNQQCLVENCSQCMQGNPSVCRTCANGFYMYNNQCLQSCPFRLRADRIAWTCLEPPVFAWYWIFPSRSSCRLRCGRQIDSEMDCSCREDCFRFANCCQDIEDYCPQYVYWK